MVVFANAPVKAIKQGGFKLQNLFGPRAFAPSIE